MLLVWQVIDLSCEILGQWLLLNFVVIMDVNI